MKRERVPKEVREAADAEIERLTNKVDEVVAHAVRVIGEACEVHQGLAKRQGFAEFYSKYPKGCAWCSADRVLFLATQNSECARGMDKLAKELAEAQARADREYKLRMDESVKWSVELQKAQREIAEGKKREERLKAAFRGDRLRSSLATAFVRGWYQGLDGINNDAGKIEVAEELAREIESALSGGTDEAK